MTVLSIKSRLSFTLIEILVVVAILAILAAILFPAFSSVRESARRTSCASNVRQIGLAMRQYVDDYNGFYPNIYLPQAGCSWVDSVYPYVKSEAVFSCPNIPYGDYRTGCAAGGPNPDDPSVLVSYNGSYDFVTRQGDYVIYRPFVGSDSYVSERRQEDKSETSYVSPSTTVMLTDGGKAGVADHDFFSVVSPGANDLNTMTDLKNAGIVARHTGGANLTYADGHTKWMKLESMLHRGLWRADGLDNPPPTPTPTP